MKFRRERVRERERKLELSVKTLAVANLNGPQLEIRSRSAISVVARGGSFRRRSSFKPFLVERKTNE